MSKLSIVAIALIAVLGAAVCAPAPAAAQLCEPLDNGRMATPFYEGTAIFWEPEIEYRKMVLTITGPCEDIVKTFGPKDTISFDIREIERITDGQYSWQLRREANIDEGVQQDLQEARGTGEEDALWWNYFQKGAIPDGPYVDSGSFSVVRGEIVDPNSGEEKSAAVATKGTSAAAGASVAAGFSDAPSGPGAAGGGDGNTLATKDFVINDDLIVFGSTCVGFDCVNGETFGFDTIRLKENNLRIGFDDTSTAASFPTRNWQIRANDSANGGRSFLGFVDQNNSGTSEGGDLVFAVEAGAPTHALYVEDSGDAGFGTQNPVVDLHAVDGDSPTLRLEQDGSSGFAPQTWDIAGNETNFFVRDVTNGSTLPFRIRPGAPSSSIFIDVGGDVGMGTSSPQVRLDVQTDANAEVVGRVQNKSSSGYSGFEFLDHNGDTEFFFGLINSDGSARLNSLGGGHMELRTSNTERLRIAGNGNIGIGGVTSPSHPIEHTSGAHLTAGGTWMNGSSREIKEDIVDLSADEAMTAFSGLKPVKFRYSAEFGEEYVGFIAEDVPELVATTDRKALSPMDIVAVMTKIVQEQQDVISKMEGELGAKNAQIEQLVSDVEQLKAAVATMKVD